MCGIAGVVSLSPTRDVDPGDLRTMADALRHRGPDDDGYYLDPHGRAGLGFRRLAIIDVAGGRQPIANEDGTVHVVFNGEIYNFRELRTELEREGHVFRTSADSETIVHAYEQWGEDCLEHLDGMFSIAIWDERSGALQLARDRLGQKPLCYLIHDDRLYFASEAKAILALPGAPRDLDEQALIRFLLFQYVPAPHSIFRGFRKIPPGSRLIVHAGSTLDESPQRFWSVPHPPPFQGSYHDARTQLGELLTAAVEKRLMSDVPLGAFLSGGVDSSIVVGLMRELGVSPLRTFAIGFEDRRYDESAHARRVAQHFATEHHEYGVTHDAAELLDTLAWHYDEPFADSSAIPTYHVSRWTRQFVTVALTGDAGDECFAGYDRYHAAQIAGRFDTLPNVVRQMIASAARLLPHRTPKSRTRRAFRFLSALALSPPRRYMEWIKLFSSAELCAGLKSEFKERIDLDEPLRWFDEIYASAGGAAPDRANHTDLLTYLPFDLLTKVDIASMAVGLECRSPFLDHELVEFTRSLPLEWRMGKRILKDWAADFVPRETLTRPKMGFGVPVGEWFRTELRELVEREVLGPESLANQVFDPAWLREYVGTHLSGRANHEYPIWALLMLERWRQCWNVSLG